jgi:hypothetical protein
MPVSKPHGELPDKADFGGVIEDRHAASAARLRATRPQPVWVWSKIVADLRKDGSSHIERGLEPRWAAVARYSKGTKEERNNRREKDKRNIRQYLRRNNPTERWAFRFRTVPETYPPIRQLEMRFEGFMTFDEADAYWADQRRKSEIRAQIQSAWAKTYRLRQEEQYKSEAEALRQSAMRARALDEK